MPVDSQYYQAEQARLPGSRDAEGAVARGDIAPAEASELARVVDTAMRAIEAREAEFRGNHFWGRERSPAAPPSRPFNPASDPA